MAILVIVLALFVSLAEVQGCKCIFGTHPQDFFCRADYVLRGRVLSAPVRDSIAEHPQSRSFRYWPTKRNVLSHVLRVTEIFKGNAVVGLAGKLTAKHQSERAPLPYKVKIYADVLPCSIKLHPRTDYLLAGLVDDERLFISLCHMVLPWKTVTRAQKIGIRGLYDESCRCRAISCSFLGPGGNILDNYCSRRHLYCGVHGLSCSWKHVNQGGSLSNEYDKCKASSVPGLHEILIRNN